MPRHFIWTENHTIRLGAGALGAILTADAALAAGLAREHMALVGAMCGASSQPHCSWCYGAAGLALAGIAAFAACRLAGGQGPSRSPLAN